MKDLYFSCDVEANGRIYGIHSMLSLGCAVFTIEKELVGKFSVNIDLIENGQEDPETMEFWSRNQTAYDATRVNTVSPENAMKSFDSFVNSFDKKKIFMGFPAAYDFAWVTYYLKRFANSEVFGHSNVIDLKAIGFTLLKPKSFTYSSKRNFPKRWFESLPHTHVALDDAIEQGYMGVNMLREALDLPIIYGMPPVNNI